MSKLKLYYDLMSQPSRAVYMFVKLNKIPFEDKAVALRTGNKLLNYADVQNLPSPKWSTFWPQILKEIQIYMH